MTLPITFVHKSRNDSLSQAEAPSRRPNGPKLQAQSAILSAITPATPKMRQYAGLTPSTIGRDGSPSGPKPQARIAPSKKGARASRPWNPLAPAISPNSLLTPPTPHPAGGTPALHLHATPDAPSVAPVCDRRIALAPTLIERSDNSTRPSRLRPSAINHPPSVLRRSAAFTLIELLVVVAVIGILAGLALAAMGGIQQRGARAKAESEIQALSAAIEEYYRDYSAFPSSNSLYAELTTDGASTNTNKVYFEPSPGMIGTNGSQKFFQDPWGNRYTYTTNAAGFFEIVCTNL